MKHYEVGYSLRGSITLIAENSQQAKANLKDSDSVSSYELLEGAALNIEEVGNDAIGIDDVRETDGPVDEYNHVIITYSIICGSSQIPKKTLISHKDKEIDEAVHEHFKSYWGENNTSCGDRGYRYNRNDWLEAIRIDGCDYITSFEAEILRKYL